MEVGRSGAKRSEPLQLCCGGNFGCDWETLGLWVWRRLLVQRLLVRRLLVWGGITAFLAHIYLAEGGWCQPIGTLSQIVALNRHLDNKDCDGVGACSHHTIVTRPLKIAYE